MSASPGPAPASLDPGACALFLLAAFVLAGVAQVAWLASPWSRGLTHPIDGGRTFRGRRVFGENKTLRGFVVMMPATACAFVAVSQLLLGGNPESFGLWSLAPIQYALLGGWAGLGFMAGELPNSFLKRQLDIPPGGLSANRPLWQLAADRVDSGLGMLVALAIAVPVPGLTWVLVLVLGWTLHWGFSAVLFRLRVKPRLA